MCQFSAKMNICVVFVLRFISYVDCTGRITYVKAKAEPLFTDRVVNSSLPIGELTNTTHVRCSSTCLGDVYCMSYFYNNVTKTCRTFDVDFIDPEVGISEAGWSYYTVIRDCRINDRDCPADYTYVSSLCFCYKYVDIQSTYAEAQEYCGTEGGYLVKIERERKQQVMVDFLASLPDPLQPNGDIFIQGMRTNGTSDWMFESGQTMRYFRWNEEKAQPEQRPDENVIAIQKIWGSMWHDTMRTVSIMFVCEIPL